MYPETVANPQGVKHDAKHDAKEATSQRPGAQRPSTTLTLTDPTYRTSAKTKCRELDPLLQIVGGMKASYQLLQATEQQMDIAIWHDGLRKQSYGCGHSGEVLPTYHNALIAY